MEKFDKINRQELESEKNNRYFFEEVFEELEPLTFSLVKKLKENIDRGEYDMLIGDDASGRIPTLVIRGIVNSRNKILHPELKESELEIKTRFVAGGQIENKKELEGAFERIKLENAKKALVITEYINSGKSIKRLADALKERGLLFDVATFLSLQEELPIEKTNLYYGASIEDTEYTPKFYDIPELGGVVKDSQPKEYAIPLVKDLVAEKDEIKDIQEKINLARKDVDLLVKKTIKEVWGE